MKRSNKISVLKNITLTITAFLLMSSCYAQDTIRLKHDRVNTNQELYRPQFHFTPEANWMNDPNGLVYYNNTYHLFYQYYPDATVWGPMHWGHATSKDLLEWKHEPVALYPDKHGYIFSGSAVIDKNNTAGFGKNAMVAIFTYHDPVLEKEKSNKYQTQGIAYSLDEGKTWTKYKNNPVIPNPGVNDFRDPKVFWNQEKSAWQLILVAKDHVQIYESKNLKDWSKISEFRDTGIETLGVWECPDLFKLPVEGTNESKWVLIISHGNQTPNGGSGTRYFIGDYDGVTFTTHQKESKWIDHGADNYAGVTYNNTPDGKRLFIGWMSNWEYATSTPTKKWRSAMTLPKELSLVKNKNEEYILKNEPIQEFSSLLKPLLKVNSTKTPYTVTNDFLSQSQITLDVNFEQDINVVLTNSLKEEFVIKYNASTNELITDRTKSSHSFINEKFLATGKQSVKIVAVNKFQLKIIVDKSSIEVLVNNGEYTLTNQVFPSKYFNVLNINTKENSVINNLTIDKIGTTLK